MSQPKFRDHDLEAFLDEGLSPDEMNAVEEALRNNSALLKRLIVIRNRRDQGVHTLGAIWRRHRISCPTREQLGSLLLGIMHEPEQKYVQFHLDVVGCSYCLASFADMKRRQQESQQTVVERRAKYFQSSAGYLKH